MLCDDIDLSTKRNIIYMIRNELSPEGKCYIGQTRNTFNERYLMGIGYSCKNRYLKRAIEKYGERAFITHILEENIDPAKLNERETYFIKKFDSANPKKGYNLTLGGGSYGSPSEETRKIQSLVKIKPLNEVIKDFRVIHGDLYDYSLINDSNYINSFSFVPVICNKCSRKWNVNVSHHMAGWGCKGCSLKFIAQEQRDRKKEQVIEDIKTQYGDLYDISRVEIDGWSTCGYIGCKNHGFVRCYVKNIKKGKICPRCSDERSESIIKINEITGEIVGEFFSMKDANQDRLSMDGRIFYKNMGYRIRDRGFLKENGFIYKFKTPRSIKAPKTKISDIKIAPVIKVNIKTGEIVEEYRSLLEASRERFKIKQDYIYKVSNVLRYGREFKEDGFVWRYKECNYR